MSEGPVLVTERLELWKPSVADLGPMFDIVSHPETGRYLGVQRSFADHFQHFSRNAGSWQLYGYGSFMVRRRGEAGLLGNCGIFHSWRGIGADFDDCPEAGWILRVDSVGQGYGGEAMRAVLAWFEREHGARRIVCAIEPGNDASLALAGKLGFAAFRNGVFPDGAQVKLLERAAGSRI